MVGVRRLTWGSAAVGAMVWLGLVATELITGGAGPFGPFDPFGPLGQLGQLGQLGPTRRLFLLAPLVVVPLCLGLVGEDVRHAALLQPPAALLATASVVLPPGPAAGLLSLPWAGVTVLLAWAAIGRIRERVAADGRGDLPAILVDAGLLYSTVGSTALVLSTAGIGFPGFEVPVLGPVRGFGDAIVFLTAVHFHFAGFVVPVLAGVTGEFLHAGDGTPARHRTDSAARAFAPIGWVVVLGPAFIGLGITFSPLVEVLAVTAFTVAVAALAALTLAFVARELDPLSGALVGLSALVLPVSMTLALAFGLSVYVGVPIGLDIPTMVRWHGHLNALGFAVPGALGWRLATRPPR